ncbi:MAG TPA: copper chaperone PCu(A)C [Azospirillum sp.]|nr:copper chaperone PCu(A)C [Azospirillum sp.]
MKLFSAALLSALLAAATAFAQGKPAATVGSITIADPWSRATAPGAANGAFFFVATNAGGEADRIVSASSPVAQKVELHTHRHEDGVMKMRPVEAIEVKPGEPAMLRPGGLHVMLMGLKEPLKQGSRFPVTLTFAKAGAVTVEVPVQEAGAMGPGGMANGHPMPMGHAPGGQHQPMKP